jgi:hypothetical protein
MSARADFLDLIREICTDSDFKMDLFSSGWVVRLFRVDGKSSFIYGYCFDLNGSASQQVRLGSMLKVDRRFAAIRTRHTLVFRAPEWPVSSMKRS